MKRGQFEQADGGTLFLDEIGDMSLNTQAKVLRPYRNSNSLGSAATKLIKVDVRVLAASNKNLEKEIEKGHVSRGPLLPAQRGADYRAAVAGAPGRHSGAHAPFHEDPCRGAGAADKEVSPEAWPCFSSMTGRAISANCGI